MPTDFMSERIVAMARCRTDPLMRTAAAALFVMFFGLIAAHGPAVLAQQTKVLTPEQKMQARFPQPVRVGDLIGLPVLDWNDSTIGYIRRVEQTEQGKIQLIVPYRKWFGWVSWGGVFDWGRRPVVVPIEVVAILGRQVAALDMDRAEFDAAPTWTPSQTQPLPEDRTIRIAITRR